MGLLDTKSTTPFILCADMLYQNMKNNSNPESGNLVNSIEYSVGNFGIDILTEYIRDSSQGNIMVPSVSITLTANSLPSLRIGLVNKNMEDERSHISNNVGSQTVTVLLKLNRTESGEIPEWISYRWGAGAIADVKFSECTEEYIFQQQTVRSFPDIDTCMELEHIVQILSTISPDACLRLTVYSSFGELVREEKLPAILNKVWGLANVID